MPLPNLYQLQLQQAQTDHMFDEITVIEFTLSSDELGAEVRVPVDGVTMAAQVIPQQGSEQRKVTAEPLVWDATLRVPLSSGISRGNKIRWNKHFGTAREQPEIFEVVSPPQEGPSGALFRLLRVEL